jgi:hypothetical protein
VQLKLKEHKTDLSAIRTDNVMGYLSFNAAGVAMIFRI